MGYDKWQIVTQFMPEHTRWISKCAEASLGPGIITRQVLTVEQQIEVAVTVTFVLN